MSRMSDVEMINKAGVGCMRYCMVQASGIFGIWDLGLVDEGEEEEDNYDEEGLE